MSESYIEVSPERVYGASLELIKEIEKERGRILDEEVVKLMNKKVFKSKTRKDAIQALKDGGIYNLLMCNDGMRMSSAIALRDMARTAIGPQKVNVKLSLSDHRILKNYL